MKLLYAKFSELPGYEHLEIVPDDVNVFVGPNGAGKSTVLQVLRFALDLLARKTVAGYLGDHEAWHLFKTAELIFEGNISGLELFPELVEGGTDKIGVGIRCEEGKFFVESVDYGSQLLITYAHPIEDVEEAGHELFEIQRKIEEIEKAITALPKDRETMSNLRSENSALQEELKESTDKLDELRDCQYVRPGKIPQEIGRDAIDGFLQRINFPKVEWINTGSAIEDAIPLLIDEVCKLQAGRQTQKREATRRYDQLQHLLQHEVDFHQDAEGKYLTINGTDYRKTSSGTRVSLGYFALTHLLGETDIVIWDEPENGLHPTRRIRVLDLIVQDGRQFFIATHALEFSPIFSDRGQIFRCDATFPEGAEHATLDVRAIEGRKEGFKLLEALGVQPARTLFTANVVVWVEGPTELIFYRHWLKHILQPKGIEEGFHYTIMHYGGGLISYLEAADDGAAKETFDALSICRNLVILVDSDFREAPQGERSDALKPGAKRVMAEVERLNAERPGAGLFGMTGGREIENYLPAEVLRQAASKCWVGYTKYAQQLDEGTLSFGRYDSFEESLEAWLKECGVTETKVKAGQDVETVIGKTMWGAVNKVEMMRMALTSDGLLPSNLRWGFAQELSKITDFIEHASQS